MCIKRCAWVTADPLYQDYHDHEWGVPQHDERYLFEMLLLEGLQAGLSWWVVLKKRQRFREVMDNFDAAKIAAYDQVKLDSMLRDPGLIRHRVKLAACRHNARCYLDLRAAGVTLHALVWGLVDGKPLDQPWPQASLVPTSHRIAVQLSDYLRQHKFKYVGDTICYAYLQAIGVVNDHLSDCVSRCAG